MNSDISKLLGTPCNLTEGKHVRPGKSGAGAGSLGDGKFLPDAGRDGYGTAGVTATKNGRSGPSGRT